MHFIYVCFAFDGLTGYQSQKEGLLCLVLCFMFYALYEVKRDQTNRTVLSFVDRICIINSGNQGYVCQSTSEVNLSETAYSYERYALCAYLKYTGRPASQEIIFLHGW